MELKKEMVVQGISLKVSAAEGSIFKMKIDLEILTLQLERR